MNLCKRTIFTLLFLLNAICCAQHFPDSYFEDSYGRLQYGFYVPENFDSTKTYPLLTYLHGWSNNYSVYLDWYDSDFQAEHPCFVFTPKTPTTWADWSGWWDQLTEPMTAAMHVMDSLISVYPIDTNRLYVYGISMGGEGTFDLLHKFPEKFAAAMSVCGGGQPFWAENIAKTPFWMFHGSADNVNPPKLTEQVYDELVSMGARKMRYKSYPGYGHNIWDVAQNEPSWHDWMFAHSKSDTACAEPTSEIFLNAVKRDEDKIDLSWNDIRNADERADKIWFYKIHTFTGIAGTTEFDKTQFTLKIENTADTLWVTAINYHFKESAPSNKIVSINGEIEAGVNSAPVRLKDYKLGDNYPNPFNPATVISYSIPETEKVLLTLYDITGREVTRMIDAVQPAGEYNVTLTADNLSSGLYLYHLQAGNFSQTKKLTLLQ